LLRLRHLAPEWATFAELRKSTGFRGARYLDFYAFNTWPSKRFLKIAYEIKVSRSDFARELNNPLKRAWATEVADECYFAAPSGMIQADEVPEEWGLIEMVKNGLRIKNRAKQRHIETLPIGFIAMLARRSSDEPSAFPSAVWLLAGQELTEEALEEVVTIRTGRKINDAQLKAIEDANAQYADHRELWWIIMRNLGREFTNPTKLTQWFVGDGRAKREIDSATLLTLRRLRNDIDSLLSQSEVL